MKKVSPYLILSIVGVSVLALGVGVYIGRGQSSIDNNEPPAVDIEMTADLAKEADESESDRIDDVDDATILTKPQEASDYSEPEEEVEAAPPPTVVQPAPVVSPVESTSASADTEPEVDTTVYISCGGTLYSEDSSVLLFCLQQEAAELAEQEKVAAEQEARNFVEVLRLTTDYAYDEILLSVDEILQNSADAGLTLTSPSAIAAAIERETYRATLLVREGFVDGLREAIAITSNSYQIAIYEEEISLMEFKIELMKLTGEIN